MPAKKVYSSKKDLLKDVEKFGDNTIKSLSSKKERKALSLLCAYQLRVPDMPLKELDEETTKLIKSIVGTSDDSEDSARQEASVLLSFGDFRQAVASADELTDTVRSLVDLLGAVLDDVYS